MAKAYNPPDMGTTGKHVIVVGGGVGGLSAAVRLGDALARPLVQVRAGGVLACSAAVA